MALDTSTKNESYNVRPEQIRTPEQSFKHGVVLEGGDGYK